MPFGALPQHPAGVRFRLWAPAADSVDLLLERDGAAAVALPMPRAADGWFDAKIEDAGAGDRYRYRIDGGTAVPDPASRFNPQDVAGPSAVVDPTAFEWDDDGWSGRPWSEAVVYELHVGTFSAAGTFAGVTSKLDHLASLGVTAIELMPVADFAGSRGWGYDGVLPFAPDSSYGSPEDLKRLVCAAHARGMMVLLDVVYNHFGPEGNHLHAYAPQFFTDRHRTPWGAAINFDGDDSRWVRRFFVENALYWIEEYHLDGLRFDAVHAIADDSPRHLLEEIAGAVRSGPGRDRHVHLVLENDDNGARWLSGPDGALYDAQWNDDLHHAFHVALTGECDGYYADYARAPVELIGRCLVEGFAYQGEPSPYRDGAPRGEPSAHLPATAFVGFLQNHDQVGNRALGERLAALADPAALRCAVEVLLLAPSTPMLFMGEEFGAATPFLYFCDFHGELATAVTRGRRAEFAKFARFASPEAAAAIPDPNAETTFAASRLDWDCVGREPHADWLRLYRRLLGIRRDRIVPRLATGPARGIGFRCDGDGGLCAGWQFADDGLLLLTANLGGLPMAAPPANGAQLLHRTRQDGPVDEAVLPPWSVRWTIRPA
jgi:maltooligosyltrehalose trehalohydrolase